MKCPLCQMHDPKSSHPDISQLDNCAEHLMILVDEVGSVHVHGPFGNPIMMRNMVTMLTNEMEKRGIAYSTHNQQE